MSNDANHSRDGGILGGREYGIGVLSFTYEIRGSVVNEDDPSQFRGSISTVGVRGRVTVDLDIYETVYDLNYG